LRPALTSVLAILLAGGVILLILASRGSGMVRPAKVVEQLMLWSVDSQFQDWPGPVRVEPTITTEAVLVGHGGDGIYDDPVGDVVVAVVDIIEVETQIGRWGLPSLDRDVFFRQAGDLISIPDPRKEWVAYGIVVDYTGDGRPDVRYGTDNASDGSQVLPSGYPLTAETIPQPPRLREEEDRLVADRWWERTRMWRTDLATGVTRALACCEVPDLMDAAIPLRMEDGEETTRGHMFVVPQDDERVFYFYVWASMIEDGRVVSTDYAPDSGWIDISP
jgi:hypothetical protein